MAVREPVVARAVVECGCPGCEAGLEPFTVEHFRVWALALELDTGEAWVVEAFFAAYLEDYFAGIPECWLIVPEENTKTTSLAGLATYLLEHRPVASIPWAASSRDQAEIGYRQAEGFVLRSARLRSVLKCQEGYRRIKNLQTGGRIQVFAADDKHADGIIPTDPLLDELHRHKDMRLYRTWRGKLGKRGGQMGAISTAGEPGSEFELTRERIRQTVPVVERRPGFVHCRSDQIALHEYAVSEDGDVEDMAVVKAANPFSGITIEALAAKRSTPTMTLSHWRRFVCNLPTRADEAAISETEWFAAKTDTAIPEGERIWLGVDLGWKYDTTALVPLWMRDPEFRLLGPATILTPPRDGTFMDPFDVQRALLEIHETYPLGLVVIDPWEARDIIEWLREELGVEVLERDQTQTHQARDYAYFTEALRNGWLKHSGDIGLTRHVMNATVRMLPKGDRIFNRPAKQSKGFEQDQRVVDALVAAAMVHATAAAELTSEPEPAGSWGAV